MNRAFVVAVATAVLAAPLAADPVHQAAAAHKHASREMVRELAEHAGAAEPEQFADAYTLLFEGTLVLRQVHDRDDAARVARPVFERLIESHVGSG